MKLSDLAQKLDCRLESPNDVEITGVAGLEEAQPGQVTFLANKRYTPLLKTTRASASYASTGFVVFSAFPRSAPALSYASTVPADSY